MTNFLEVEYGMRGGKQPCDQLLGIPLYVAHVAGAVVIKQSSKFLRSSHLSSGRKYWNIPVGYKDVTDIKC